MGSLKNEPRAILASPLDAPSSIILHFYPKGSCKQHVGFGEKGWVMMRTWWASGDGGRQRWQYFEFYAQEPHHDFAKLHMVEFRATMGGASC